MYARHFLVVVMLCAAAFVLATMSSADEKSTATLFAPCRPPFGIDARIECAPQWAVEQVRVAIKEAEREEIAREEAAKEALSDAVTALSAVVENHPATKAAADAEAALEAVGFDVVDGRVYPADVFWLGGIPILR